MKRILIIEDDAAIAGIEKRYLELEQFSVETAGDGPAGLQLAREGSFDLILLDLMLPGMDGFAVCRQLRETLDIPILLVSALQEDLDKIMGLGFGADDYIEKPFSPGVLVARVKAHLAQYARLTGAVRKPTQISLGGITVQPEEHRVYRNGRELALKPKEYDLLLFLMQNPERVFSRETLYERIWGMEAMGDNATVAVHINRLREKIEENPALPRRIQTVWGAGYRFSVR